ncbi:HCL564Cp [Eremothecium sinecaudum]|uniref:Ribokinase n=1 Tax=Eremothecium sinecaudum TaxID=45286 RepID=A0A109UYD1_9SACH|nr:HCL564Cp [Eremothecium sinecaudum]AMD19587.1 HCL564Cp [Eremothecium sinecaudum]
MAVIVIGSLNYDMVTFTGRSPKPGETIRGKGFETHGGGKGLNQALATNKLLPKSHTGIVKMVGNIGKDSFAAELLGIAESYGLDTTHIKVNEDQHTGIATIIVDESTCQNCIIVSSGANDLTVLDPDRLEEVFSAESKDEIEYVILQNEIPDPSGILSWLKENRPNKVLVYNPSPFVALEKKRWLDVDILILNEVEAIHLISSLYKEDEVQAYRNSIQEDAVKGYRKVLSDLTEMKLINQRQCGTIIITLGALGVLFSSKQSQLVQHIAAVPVKEVVDTTGAGDTFLGGVISQLYLGSDLVKALEFAVNASSIAITRKGASSSIPTYVEVREIMN